MIKRLITLSNILDSKGFTKEAIYIDSLIRLAADEEDDNVIKLPFVKPQEKKEEGNEMTLFTEEGSFIDYDEALSELMSSVSFLTMPMSQRDWQNFGRETIKQQISGLAALQSFAPVPDLRDVSMDSREGSEEGREQVQKEMLEEAEVADSEGRYTDYAYAVEVTLRLLNLVASLDVLPSNIHEIAQEHQDKVQDLMREVYIGEEESSEENGNILSFPAREGRPDMDSLDHMSLDFSEEDED